MEKKKDHYTAISMIPLDDDKSRTTKLHTMPSKFKQNKRRDSNVIYENDLLKAVAKNDVEKCKIFLEEDILAQNPKEYYFHPLLLAAKKGHHEVMELLLENCVDINVQDKKNSTALHFAIQQRNIVCCNTLIKNGIDVNVEDKFGNLPLHIAASEGILEIVEKLIEKGNTPNAKNKKDQTPLHLACIKGNGELLTSLLDKGGKWDIKDVNSWLPIHCAAFHGHYKCCEILVSRTEDKLKAHVNSRNQDRATPLILAAKKGHSRCCIILNNSDINAFDNKRNTALHLAASTGFLNTVEVLLGMEPNIYAQNKDGNTPLHKAAMLQSADCLKMLLEKYPDVNPGLNSEARNLLHLSANSNSIETLKFLLEIPTFKAQINDQDKNGKTALNMALSENHPDSPELLISKGANCFITDNEQNLPLHIAAGKGVLIFCRVLLLGDRVQKINNRNLKGKTALHLAARKGSVECCKFLLTKGADLCAIDSDGFSPFHVASQEGNLDVLKYFTKKGGGYINQASEISGDTPLHLAARIGSYDCCEFILRNMKKTLILKTNYTEKRAMDEAFDAEQDQIFSLILSKVPLLGKEEKHIEYYYPFEHSLHNYMHLAINNKRGIIEEAIVNSEWWYSGFSPCFCDQDQCPNLNNLTKANPILTEVVYGKCIVSKESSTIYNFRIFEDSYYVPVETAVSEYLKRKSPFDPDGKLRKDAKMYPQQNEHPLMVASQNERVNLMRHLLAKTYLDYKWHSYMKIILWILAFCDIFLVIVMGLYLCYVRDYEMLTSLNLTKEDICSENKLFEVPEAIAENLSTVIAFYVLLVIMTIVIIGADIHFHLKKHSLLSLLCEVRIYRVLGIVILLIPTNGCFYDIPIKETWQWQLGIITLLFSWFYMIHTLNEIPCLSVFMPLTLQFGLGFIRVLMYIILIVFIFAFIFHLLLYGNSAFDSIPISFVKTIVWMLGDLGYDDTFLGTPIRYPVMTNIIFLLLVTCISGFIINLIIAQPTDYADKFRERAAYHKLMSRIELFLRIDFTFTYFTKRYLIAYYEIENNQPAKAPIIGQLSSNTIDSTHNNSGESGMEDNPTLKLILKKLERIEAQLSGQNA